MEPEVVNSELLLPTVLLFKKVQMGDKYPKGQARGRHWKHLKQILQAENYQSYPANEPNYLNIETPPSMYPSKKFCDITGFEETFVGMPSSCRLQRNCIQLKDYTFNNGVFGCKIDRKENPYEMHRTQQAPYVDPRTKLRYANPEVFKRIRVLPNEYVQRYLSQRNAAVILR